MVAGLTQNFTKQKNENEMGQNKARHEVECFDIHERNKKTVYSSGPYTFFPNTDQF